jgi:sulfatase maturation enzyme AslB (radical SAM superfamily)
MEKKYCAAPWRGLHINFRGDVKTCCAGDPNMLGDLNNKSLHDIIQSDKMQEIRASIKAGDLHPEYCYNCIQAERNGSSERDWHNNVNPEFDASSAALDEHRPTLVDVRWNITCNLSCNYCGPYCSSKWASMKKQFVDNGVKPYHRQVIDYMMTNKDDIREVALVGGEPLLLKENATLLALLPKEKLVTIITNMSVNFDKNEVAKQLFERSNVGWSMSFENVGPRFEYVRHGGNWEQLEKNLDWVTYLMKNRGHHGGIHAVYNVYNCTRLTEIMRFARSKGVSIIWQTLYQPEYLDPLRHNSTIRELALHEIQKVQSQFNLNGQENWFFNNIKQNLQDKISGDNLTEEFVSHINNIETQYHPDQKNKFAELWPEIAQAL